jgi:hypothetical protein
MTRRPTNGGGYGISRLPVQRVIESFGVGSEAKAAGSEGPRSRLKVSAKGASKFWIWGVGIALGAAQLAWALPHFTFPARVAAVGVLLLLLWSVSSWLKDRQVRSLVLVAACGQLYVGHALSQFSQSELGLRGGAYAPSEAALEKAAWGAFVGGLLLVLGWQLGSQTNVRHRARIGVLNNFRHGQQAPLYAHLVLGIALQLTQLLGVVSIPPEIRTPLSFIMNPYISWAVILLVRKADGDLRIPLWAYGVATVLSLGGLIVVATAVALTPWAFLALVHVGLTRKVPVRWVLVGVALAIAFNEAKGRYRGTSSYQGTMRGERIPFDERKDVWTASAREVRGQGAEQALKTFLDRTSENLPLAQIIELVPTAVPYRAGKNLEWVVLFSVPRFLFPSKPPNMELFFVDYGISFGYLSATGQELTRVGISALGEGFWHFGWPGLCLFSLINGIVLGAVYGGFGYPDERNGLACISLAASQFPITAVIYLIPSMIAFLTACAIAVVGLLWLGSVFKGVGR